MPLPSQGGIGFGGATRGRRRRGKGRGGRKPLAVVVVLLLVGGLVWAYYPAGEKPKPEGIQPTTLVRADAEQRGSPPGMAATGDTRTAQASPGGARPGVSESPGSTPTATPAVAQTPTQQPQPSPAEVSRSPEQPSPSREVPAPSVLATPEQTISRTPATAVATLLERAEAALKANDPLAAREHYNRALMHERASADDRARIRQRMTELNNDLIFSPRVYPKDPFSAVYEVQSGDSLARIAQREGVATEWLLIQRVNRLSNPRNIAVGQRLKLVRGPFHAVVSKSAFRMDVYIGPPDEPDQWMYVRSFRVGLGEHDGTPLGAFTVRRHSKLINPYWRNPRTGEEFAADDPKNPIGEHWIGLRGLGQAETFNGYGIHGTIEPDSIGRQQSMGCVRMLPDDVALVYELLAEEISRVHIVE